MLTAGKMVGFVLTKDYDGARAFYEGKLGFTFVVLTPVALIMRAGENLVRIVKVEDFVPLKSTVLGWEISDIEAIVGWLGGTGSGDGKISVGRGQRTRDMDYAGRRQSGVVQGSRREYFVGEPAPVGEESQGKGGISPQITEHRETEESGAIRIASR